MDPIQSTKDICSIVLTFDDGPNPETTPKLLDFLNENDIKVIFFVIGRNLITKQGSSIIRRAHVDGHIIGNHTFSHINLMRLSKPQIRDEIFRAHELICQYTETCVLFRPPFGVTNKAISQVLAELGYSQLFWNVDTMDWKYKKNAYWIDYGMKKINHYGNNIILMHDIYPTTVGNIRYFIERIKSIPNICFSIVEYQE
jgi:peptidoglycan/xylan/chitin deacetylase (PgdA/CDA1 family)